jgi:hypothetical protein
MVPCGRRRDGVRCPRRRGRSGFGAAGHRSGVGAAGRRWGSAPPGAAGVRAAAGCSASAAPGAVLRAALWSRFGNEGEDPGACCSLSRATRRRARVFRSTLPGDGPNWVGLRPVSGTNSTQFANCAGSASVSGANPAQFANHLEFASFSEAKSMRFADQRGRCCERRAACGQPRAQGARKPAGFPPSLPKRDHQAERRAEPGGADAKRRPARPRGERRPAPRTPQPNPPPTPPPRPPPSPNASPPPK